MNSQIAHYATPLLIGLFLCQGCVQWNATSRPSEHRLPTAHMSPQAVGLEIATVTLQPGQEDMLMQILSTADEQSIEQSKRSELAKHGLRAGILGTHIPNELNLLLIEASDRRLHPTAESQRYTDQQRFVHCRPGTKALAQLWGTRDIPEVVRAVCPIPITQGSASDCYLSVSSEPKTGSASLIRLTPEVAFGPIRQRFAVQDNAFHLDAKRESHAFDDLTVELSLHPGEIILVCCAPDAKESLGRAFFHHGDQQKLVVIRLAQTQVDEFYQP